MAAPKKPQDHKTKAVQNEADNADFEFTGNDGETYSVPSFRSIKTGTLRRIRNMSELDQMFTILEDFADEDALAAVDDFDGDQLKDFYQGWTKASGITVPQS